MYTRQYQDNIQQLHDNSNIDHKLILKLYRRILNLETELYSIDNKIPDEDELDKCITMEMVCHTPYVDYFDGNFGKRWTINFLDKNQNKIYTLKNNCERYYDKLSDFLQLCKNIKNLEIKNCVFEKIPPISDLGNSTKENGYYHLADYDSFFKYIFYRYPNIEMNKHTKNISELFLRTKTEVDITQKHFFKQNNISKYPYIENATDFLALSG